MKKILQKKFYTYALLVACMIISLPLYAQNNQVKEKKYSSIKDKKEEEKKENDADEKSLQNKEEGYEEQEQANEKNEYAHAHSSWYYEMLKKRPNLNKAQTNFNKYFSNHPTECSRLKDRFETWQKQASLYKDKFGFGMPFPNSKRKAMARTSPPSVNGIFGTWNMIGPANMQRDQPCNNNNLVTGGYCDKVFVNPYNTQNLYAGFSYGGLWVSTNQGSTWQLTDGGFSNGTNTYANRDCYYGEIEAHKLNSSLVLAATEAGLLKSDNSGISWTLCPQLNRNVSASNRPYYVAMATDNQNIMLSTFGKKLFRSSDGGASWVVVFDNTAGGANHRFTNQYNTGTAFGLDERNFNFFGLEADFNNPDHFYLGVWNSSNQACIYESTNKGVSFSLLKNLNTLLLTNWDAATNLCLKTIPSSADKFFVYEQFAGAKPYYKFSATGSLLSASVINAYTEAFDIDWNNENTLYQGEYGKYTTASGFQKSIDGGTTFSAPFSTADGNCNYLHPDLRSVSAVGNIVLIGNDGGVGISTDGAANLTGTGFEINSMDIWGFASSPRSDICLAGLDHNQTFVRSNAADGGWKNIKGADAGVCSINPVDDHWLYYDWAYGVNKGYLNNDQTVTEYSVSTLPDLGSLQFHPNLIFNIFGIQKSNNNILLQSSDNMATASVFKDFGTKINAFRIAYQDAKTMYVLLNQATIQKSVDSGVTWVDITPSAAASSGQTNITAMDVGKTAGELWAAYGNAQNACKVLYSADGGATWTNITTPNLPAAAVASVAYQRGTNKGVYILTITSAGTIVFYKNNIMPQWQQVGSMLPMMGYLRGGLYIVPTMNKIRLGSSRGAWENDLYEPSQLIEAGIAVGKGTTECNTDSISYFDASAYGLAAVSFAWVFPGGSPAASTLMNPKVSYAAPGFYNATLTVTNQYGSNTKTVTGLVQYTFNNCCTSAPAPWQLTDIGTTAKAGTVCYTPVDKNFKITSYGAGTNDPDDAITFLNQPLDGDGQIIARVKDVSSVYNQHAGIMIRNTLSPNSAYAYLNALDNRGVFDLWRNADGTGTNYHPVTAFPLPMWLRLQRKGNTITSAYSADGIKWTTYNNYTISLGASVYAGLIVSGDGNSSNMDSVSVGPIPPFICTGNSADGCPALDTVPGKAINFYDYAYFNLPVSVPATNSFTITGWIKPKGILGSQSSILAWDNGYFYLGQNNDNQLEYVWNAGDASTTWNSGLFAPADKWSFVAMVIHPDSAVLYLNNKKATNVAIHDAAAIANCFIGNSNPGSGFFLGQMDELSFWKRSLSTNEIDSLRHLTREHLANPADAKHDPALKAYFQFNDSSTTTSYNLIDSSVFTLGNGANKIQSTAPVGGGISAMLKVTAAGNYTFGGTGVSLNFPASGTYPNGNVWVSKLNQLPDQYPHASIVPNAYWIINNYGADSAFSPTVSLQLNNSITVSAANAAAPNTFKLYKRLANADGYSWGGILNSASSATDGSPGSVIFNPAGISSDGQLFINGGTQAPQADTIAGKMLDLTPAGNPVIALSPVPLNSNAFSVMMWVKPHGLQKVFSQILSSDAPNTRFGIGISFPGYVDNLNLVYTHTSIDYGQTGNVNLLADEWNHVALTYSPDSVSIYLNGGTPWTFAKAASNTPAGFPPVDFSKAPITINADLHNQGGNYKGQIDEICFYNYPLSQQEIREKMFLTKKPVTENGLVGYYQFNQYNTATGILNDAMGNGNASTVSTTNITVSTAPVASGKSFRIADVNTPGTYNFPGTGVSLTFPGPIVPNGEMVVSRLYSQPDSLPSGYSSINNHYWIIRNWGNNNSFDALTQIKFDTLNISAADAAAPNVLKLIKRSSNEFLNNWSSPLCGAVTATAGANGSVGFDNACGNNSFSQFLITSTGTSPLPVKLISFTATALQQAVSVNWTVAPEINFSRYEVQQGTDGIHFNTIGAVAAANVSAYSFSDQHPSPGNNYYRLKMIDRDGSFGYSGIATVNFTNDVFILITPKPVGHNEGMVIQNLDNVIADVSLYTADGKLFKQYRVPANGVVKIYNLPKGAILYKALNAKGKTARGIEIVQ